MPHVDSSLYEIIVFADRSAAYTRQKPCEYLHLPYYVADDLELLKSMGISHDEINMFVAQLDAHDNEDSLSTSIDLTDTILQRIIDATDISTRLK
jgi:hypothetical protein